MVSVSELVPGTIAEQHNENTVNRHTNVVRNTDADLRREAEAPALHQHAFARSYVSSPTDLKLGIPATSYRFPVGGWIKRMVDILLALTGLLLMAPIMIFISLLILFTMGRPIFFIQQRAGFNRHAFACLKFRTMLADADDRLARHLQSCPEAARAWAASQKLKCDPRVTWLGKALRKSSLDELPQLFNILRGDMSCIGPRPVLFRELTCRYGRTADDYARAKPGLTGLWQVNGRSSTTYARRIACDRYYTRRWSLLLDFKILFRTIPAVLKTDQTS